MSDLALALVNRFVDPYKSKAEAAWSQVNALWLEDWFQCKLVRQFYEPLSFKLPGGSYTPDFLSILADGRMVFTEVKGSKHQKNYRDARSKLRAAAELYPFFIWTQATQAGRGAWDFEEVAP